MRLTTDYSGLLASAERAHAASVDVTLTRHRESVTRRSGEYAASLAAERQGMDAAIGSSLPRAAAMRFGADVGPRRGPHHGPVDTFDGGAAYGQAMDAELRR